VFRARDAADLERAINRFLEEELGPLGPTQFEEITQSEGAQGITVAVWYSLVDVVERSLEEEVDADLEVDDAAGRELA
jgi:hypothetical protein